MKHELKTDPIVFEAVLDGEKTYEIRFDDRGFKLGDVLVLKETVYSGDEMKNGEPLEFTGRKLVKVVSHILTGYGLMDGWCIMSFKYDGNNQLRQQAKDGEV